MAEPETELLAGVTAELEAALLAARMTELVVEALAAAGAGAVDELLTDTALDAAPVAVVEQEDLVTVAA